MDYVSLTPAMIADFSRLSVLELGDNDFVCDVNVAYFLRMVDETADTLEVVGWDFGYSYFCITRNGTRVTFR